MKTDNTKRIDHYLSGELSAEQHQAFELELNTNPTLREELELQSNLLEATKRAAIRAEVKSTARSYFYTKLLKWSLGGLSVIALSALLLFAFLPNNEATNSTLAVDEKTDINIPQLEEKELIPNLDREIFLWNGEDSLFFSKSGVLVSVPRGTFLKDSANYTGEVVIEWQEAVDGATIMMSGLSTMADSNLLETQGMFSFRATDKEGNLLEVNPEVGIYVQVPVDEIKTGMQLYDGKLNKEGIINWVNPVPLEKIPVSVPMSELDFYPKGYEDTLDKLKLNTSKKYRDSLYLACETNDSKKVLSGKFLFEKNCATCHHPNKDGTGPKLRDVRTKWKENGAPKEAIYEWVKNWQVAYDKYDYAKEIATLTPTAMSIFEHLNNGDINKIFDYIDFEYRLNNNVTNNDDNLLITVVNIDTSSSEVTTTSVIGESSYIHIPPSNVLSFWKPEFDNTILATREFERRMQKLHGLCKEELLDLYIKNIDKPMYYVDSMIARKGHKQFEVFAAERVGWVDLGNAHLKKLTEFYKKGISDLKSQLKQWEKTAIEQGKLFSKELAKARIEESIRTASMNEATIQQETSFNLGAKTNVQNQNMAILNASTLISIRQATRSVGFRINNNNAIKNVDRLVAEATRARKSFSGTYNNVRIEMKYNPISFQVNNIDEYTTIYAYLLPDKLNSYQRLNSKGGKFDYSLNEKISYSLVIIGINKTGFHYYEIKQVKAGELGSLDLLMTDEELVRTKLMKLNSARNNSSKPLSDELNWLKLEQMKYKFQRLSQERGLFLERMRKVVFPCYVESETTNNQGFNEISEEAFIYPDIESQFQPINGFNSLTDYLRGSTKYPEEAKELGLSGKVFVQFVVDVNGNVKDVTIIKGIHPLLDNEAKRVIESIPRFIPARTNGQNISSIKTLPITFYLN